MLSSQSVERFLAMIVQMGAELAPLAKNKPRRSDGSEIDFGKPAENFDVNTGWKKVSIDSLKWEGRGNAKKHTYAKRGESQSQVVARYRKAYGAKLTIPQLADAAARDVVMGNALRNGPKLDIEEQRRLAITAMGDAMAVRRYAKQQAATNNQQSLDKRASRIARDRTLKAQAAGRSATYEVELRKARRELGV